MSQVSSRTEDGMRLLLASALAFVVVIGAAVGGFRAWLGAPLQITEPVVAVLPEGGNLTQLLAELHGRGVLAHPTLLRYYARFMGEANRVRAGEYRLERGLTARGLLARLVDGDVIQYPVTIIEGMTARQMLARIHQEARLGVVLAAGFDNGWSQALGVGDTRSSPEGLFFPDTYHYHLGMRDADVLQAAYRHMQEVLAEEWEARAPGLPYRDPYEALVMASLVERETGVASERAEIAGVFVRRLRQGMLLQTDPSVIYGLGESFNGNLTRNHLQTPGPYNTYTNPGLPPTPIALPGRAAIHAALHPAAGEALYFVAKGDGSHVFSATLEEHNRAVQRYQVNGH